MQGTDLKQRLEERLAKMHQRKHCLIVSRGTVAIYLALKALGYETGKVVLPSILCLSPANAVIYAGLKPVFCDVSLMDFNLDVDSLERTLKTESDIRAVIMPHLYGQPTDIERIVELTEKYKVVLIEDAAQALGGSYKGLPLGSFGKFSILSFGHTKILDVGGGGALLFDDSGYLEPVNDWKGKLPVKVDNYHELKEQYSKVYYTIAALCKEDVNLGKLFLSFPHIFKDLYLFRDINDTVIENIYRGLNDLDDIVEKRNENGGYYKKHLQHEKITQPAYQWHGVYWRYSFLVNSNKQYDIAKEIRSNNIHVSNWYPPVHLFYGLDHPECKNAEYMGNHIFNLWVSSECKEEDIKKHAEVIMKALD